jgi:hypothetical protein
MTWPTKTDFVDGDVLTAAQVNNIGTNLNIFDPTSATVGQVWTADGAGSGSFATPSAKLIQTVRGTLTSNFTTSSASAVDTGLQAVITPTSASNYLVITVSMELPRIERNAGTISSRTGIMTIYNSTTPANVAAQYCGQDLTTASSSSVLTSICNTMTTMIPAPNTSANTFKLRAQVNDVNLLMTIQGSASRPTIMTISEIAL